MASGYSQWTVGSASEPLGANDILVKYTYNGDLNLDGAVDGNAATIFSTFYDNGATSGDTYAEGDLNGDGKIDGSDATIFSTVTGTGTQTNTPPLPAPAGLAVQSVTSNSVTLSWMMSTDPSVAGYDVYHGNGQLVGQNISSDQYTDTGLIPGQTYDYWITAVNSAGVQSPPTPTVEALTSENTGLVANAGAPQQVSVGQTVALNGSYNDGASNAAPMIFSWSLLDESNGDVVATANGQTLSFTAGQWQAPSQGQSADSNQTGTFLATFTVRDALGNSATASTAIYVGSPPALSIQGPSQVQTGTVANLQVVSSAPNLVDPNSYVWTVTQENQIVASSSGDQLAFEPDKDGSYSILVEGIYQDQSVTASCIVTAIASAPQNLQIVGPSQGSVGRALVFSSGAQLPADSGEQLTYSWSVTRNGEPFAIPATNPDTLQTFSFVPLPLSVLPSIGDPNPYDTYVVTLDVQVNAEAPLVLQKQVYVGWSQPPSGTWDSVFSEVSSGQDDGNGLPINDGFGIGDAIAIQPDGKVVVAGTMDSDTRLLCLDPAHHCRIMTL